MLFQVALLCISLCSVEGEVLDPALFLSPSPPLLDVKGDMTAAEMWSIPSAELRVTRNARVSPSLEQNQPSSRIKPNRAEEARFFWPSLRQPHYSVATGGIQIPLTFSVSGAYGKKSPGSPNVGMIGSIYGTVSEISGTAVSSLAGGGYGRYRTYPTLRVYGGENEQAWSGWGNGKWGHYGKG